MTNLSILHPLHSLLSVRNDQPFNPSPTSFPPLCQERPTFQSFSHFIPSSLSRKTNLSNGVIDCTATFQTSKYALAKSTKLAHPSHSDATNITVDAPKQEVAAVLEQFLGGQWAPISLFSRKLTKAETKYSAFDRELLGIYLAIKNYRYLIEGHE